MAKKTSTAAPQKAFSNPETGLEELAEAAKHCKACDLWKSGTQTVFGEGKSKAKVMLVGEQPGNQEDLEGKPFVGPAGKLLDTALEEAGIDRGKVYVTNAVKHFKWEPRGKRRIHKKPNSVEIAACRHWLDGEMAALKPKDRLPGSDGGASADRERFSSDAAPGRIFEIGAGTVCDGDRAFFIDLARAR